MAAEIGTRVREGENIYVCYQAIDPMLEPPSKLPAHFNKEV